MQGGGGLCGEVKYDSCSSFLKLKKSGQIGGTPDCTAIIKMGENKGIADFNLGICGDTPKASK